MEQMASCRFDQERWDKAFEKDDFTPLQWSILENKPYTFRALLAANVDINRKNSNERTALDLAISLKDGEMARLLHQQGATISHGFLEVLTHSNLTQEAALQEAELLELILMQAIEIDSEFAHTILNNLTIYPCYLDTDCVINILNYAAYRGTYKFMLTLCHYTPEAIHQQDSQGQAILHRLAQLLEYYMIEKKLDTQLNARYHLKQAINHIIGAIQLLEKEGADIHQPNQQGDTPLSLLEATGLGSIDIPPRLVCLPR